MKKIGKILLGLAAVSLLGSCAKSISGDEAKAIAKEIEATELTYKSGEQVTKVEKLEYKGDTCTIIAVGIKSMYGEEGKEKKESISNPSSYRISEAQVASVIASAGDKVSFSADGKALSFTVKMEETEDGVKVTTNSTYSYNAEGLPASGKIEMSYKASDSDYLNLVVSTSFSWSK